MKNEIPQVNINQILEDYQPDDDLFSEEDDKIHKLKKIIYTKLSESDRRIILLYAELGNLRAVASILNISHTTVYYQILRIRKIIHEIL